ncbi:MAG: CDP-alcohol phosphatidyltransferase family protein [Phycisphaeraceae bacterium]
MPTEATAPERATDLPLPRRIRGHLVHVYTASGIFFAFLAAAELASAEPSAARFFAWLAVTVVIDATDGFLARAWRVKTTAPDIDGRTIDDLLDYLTFAFLPLLLVWRLGWVPGSGPGQLWGGLVFVAPAMLASLIGFARTTAKEEDKGFFGGFPSYWNLAVFYAGLLLPWWGTAGNAALLLILAGLTVAPVRFVYPTLAPAPWRTVILVGTYLWGAGLVAMLPFYPDHVPGWGVWLSLSYPAFYVALSIHLDLRDRGART